MAILDEIREAIRTCGRTRYRLAKETGFSQALLSYLMSSKRSMSIETLEKLAAALGYNVTLRPRKKEGRKHGKRIV
ncbi:MAG: helix-turn-helix transcriptional regulator [Planctomycetes bacterium]|nr:helix-turn-helix transcriptional regulator [Planctomycetota bacterium]